MSDQELDNLFKEASAKYEAPFDDKEWEKMAAMLDGTSPPKSGFWNWKIVSGLALLLLMSGTVVVTQWDKLSGSAGTYNQNLVSEVVLSSTDSSSLEEDGKTKADKNNLVAKEKSNSGEKDNRKAIEVQSGTLSQANEVAQSTIASQSRSQQPALKKKTSERKKIEQEGGDQLSERPVATKQKIGAKGIVSNGTNKKSKSESNRSKTSQIGNSANQSGENKKVDKQNVTSALDGQELSSDGKKIGASATASITNETDESNHKKESITKVSNNKKEKNVSTTLVADTANGKSTDSLPVSSSIASVKEAQNKVGEQNKIAQNEKEKLSEEIANVHLLDKQNGNLNNSLASSSAVVKKGKDERVLDSAKVISAQEKKDSVISKEVKKEEKKKLDSLTKLHRFSVKLALSPDFSSVGYFTPGKTGFNYGLLAEYNITRHWSVTLGGIWSRKIYANTKRETTGSVVHLTELSGKCRVLDLPLNINYYVTPNSAFTLYGSVGLSSYIMFDENYDYYYTNGTNSYSYSSQYKKGNKEFFKMMNLSIGIQQQLSPRVRLQLEPFIKAPLSGIGGSNLKLVSSGVFLNLKYTFK